MKTKQLLSVQFTTLLASLLLGGSIPAFAAAPKLAFERTWGGPALDRASGVAPAPSGNLYVAGTTIDGDTANVLVEEFLPDGRIRNSVTWGGSGNDTGESVAIGPDGAVYVGAIAQAPPYAFRKASKKTRTPASTLVAPNGTITIPAGTSEVANGTLLIPNGSFTYAGDDEAALLKILF